MDKKVSPFVGLRAGGRYNYTNVGVGGTVRPYVGVDVWKFSISAGWDLNRMSYYHKDEPGYGWHFQVGFNF